MSQKNSDLSLPQVYKYQFDLRTDKEKLLSDAIVTNMSQLNLQRIQNLSTIQLNPLKFQYFFLCLTGIPPNATQFVNLQLPGQVVVYHPSGMQLQTLSDEQYIEILKNASIENEARKIANIISKVPKEKKIIMMFHSFGSFIVAAYSHIYKGDRIFGFVDIGGIPIRMYTVLKQTLKDMIYGIGYSSIEQHADFIFNEYVKHAKKDGFLPLQNKYQLLVFLKIISGQAYHVIFDWARNHPKVLKLILFGRKDIFFTESELNQKAVHYSYVNTVDPKHEQQLKKSYEKVYGKPVNNVQERFILSFEEGKHSLHLQPKIIPVIKAAINQYLRVIEGSVDKQTS